MKYMLKPGARHQFRNPDRSFYPAMPGVIYELEPEQLGGAIDKFLEVDDATPVTGKSTPAPATADGAGKEAKPGSGAEFTVVIVEGGYNVLHSASGEPYSDVPLTAEEAASLAGIAIEQLPVAANAPEAPPAPATADEKGATAQNAE